MAEHVLYFGFTFVHFFSSNYLVTEKEKVTSDSWWTAAIQF